MSIRQVGWFDGSKTRVADHPEFDDVMAIIKEMDGYDNTQVVLWNSDENQLTIGSGFDGLFVVCACIDGNHFVVNNSQNPDKND